METRKIRTLATAIMLCLLLCSLAVYGGVSEVAGGSNVDNVICHFEEVCDFLNQLKASVGSLPDVAFVNIVASGGQRKALVNKVDAVFNQVQAGAKQGAINKLWNDLYKSLENWIAEPYQQDLINKVSRVAVLLLDPVKTDAGYVCGLVRGDLGSEVREYRGIPYAAPPVGDLRWKPPQPVTPWEGIRNCTIWGNQAPQDPLYPRLFFGEANEDNCLNLNVLTPAKKTTDRLPVMVWFHGGGLRILTANSPTYCSTGLPLHGVVLVTVNQRLGALGYLAHPLLTQESEHNASGNYGTLDQIAALQWVQRNIAAFGGDPNCVTIFGESGGGAKVTALICSPLAKGLFHRAIIESGPTLGGTPLEVSEGWGVKLFHELGVDDEPDPLAAARALPWQDIIAAQMKIGYGGVLTVDGWVLPDTVENIFKANMQNDVPLIVGCNEADLPGMLVGTQKYVSVASEHFQSNVYAYLFTYVPAQWKAEGVKAFHGIEVPYVFGDLEGLHAYITWSLASQAGAKTRYIPFTESDYWMAEAMTSMWTQFAKTGDPSVEGLATWPSYDKNTDLYIEIGETLQVKSGFSTLIGP